MGFVSSAVGSDGRSLPVVLVREQSAFLIVALQTGLLSTIGATKTICMTRYGLKLAGFTLVSAGRATDFSTQSWQRGLEGGPVPAGAAKK